MDMQATTTVTLDSCELDINEDPETLRAVIGLMELKSYIPTPLSTKDSETDEKTLPVPDIEVLRTTDRGGDAGRDPKGISENRNHP